MKRYFQFTISELEKLGVIAKLHDLFKKQNKLTYNGASFGIGVNYENPGDTVEFLSEEDVAELGIDVK